MVLMKAVRKRAAGAGNSAPKKRQGFPDVNQDCLDEAIDNHIRVIGVKEGMNLFEYINLQPQQAENAKAIFKLHPLIKALLGVSATAEIKYRNLKQAFTVAVQRFGHELLSKHWKVEAGMLTGRAADSVLVLLKHWRRVTKNPTSWERFGSKLDNSQLQVLTSLYKKTTCKGDEAKKRRVLKKEVSDVTMASDGFPAMLETTSEEEEDGTWSEDESSMDPKTKAALAKSALEASPPPVAKKDWRLKAGKEAKGKEGKKGKKAKKTKKHTKKPAASAAASKLVAKAAVKTKPHGSAGGPETKIHTESLSIGGGKVQSYIQHMPNGPKGGKKLIVAVTVNQAKNLKKTHKQVVEELLPACKAAGESQGHWEKRGEWGQGHWQENDERPDWADWSDESPDGRQNDWQNDDGWSSDDQPAEQVTLKQRERPYRPGSHREKDRLKKVQKVQGKAQTDEELMVQRLSAMGASRFRRLQNRAHLGRKDGTAGPRYGPPADFWQGHDYWGTAAWHEQQRVNQQTWVQQQQQMQAAWMAHMQQPAVGSAWVVHSSQPSKALAKDCKGQKVDSKSSSSYSSKSDGESSESSSPKQKEPEETKAEEPAPEPTETVKPEAEGDSPQPPAGSNDDGKAGQKGGQKERGLRPKANPGKSWAQVVSGHK
eukprot:s2136_g13.t1